MFVLAAVILGLIIGKIRGGRLSAVKITKIHLWFLGLIGAILQIGLHLYYYLGAAPSYLAAVNFVSYILVLLMFIFNFNDVWTILMTIGVTANFIAAFINGGKTPVASGIVTALGDSNLATLIGNGGHALYTTLTAESTLWPLGIVLPLPIPQLGRITAVYGGLPGLSVGTILALVGVLGYVQYAMNRETAKTDDFLDDSDIGKEDYIVAPDEMENFVPKEESRYKTGPLDWLNDTTGEIFTMAGDTPVRKPEKRDAAVKNESNATVPEKTMALPDLSPELLDQIRNHGKTRNVDFSKDDKRDNLEDTRVFTTLKDLGHYDTKPIPTQKPDPVEKAITEEEAFAEDGFFTQTYYKGQTGPEAEAAPDLSENTSAAEEKQVSQATNTEIFNHEAQRDFIQAQPDDRAETEEQPMPEQKPKAQSRPKQQNQTIVPERTSSSPWASVKKPKAEKRKNREAGQKINPYRKYSAEQAAGQTDVSREDEKQMLNVWHQVSEETKALRTRGKRTTPNWNPQADPFEASEKSRQQLKREHTRAARQNHYPEEEAAGRDVNKQQRQASSRAAQGAATTLTTDEEREKAGFKKVELNVDGKSFSYWRKKKDE